MVTFRMQGNEKKKRKTCNMYVRIGACVICWLATICEKKKHYERINNNIMKTKRNKNTFISFPRKATHTVPFQHNIFHNKFA